MKTLRLFILLCVILSLKAYNAKAQFRDDFSSPTLDPAWTVVQTWPGGTVRSCGCTLPGNRYSLSDNPGFLRYYLDPMTHREGFINGYATYVDGSNIYDAGLEFHRIFNGENWLFETRCVFNLPNSTGRAFDTRIYFGTGSIPTYWVQFHRGADYNQNGVSIFLFEKTGTTPDDKFPLEESHPNGAWYYGENNYPILAPLYFRVERSGSMLTASYSDDGIVWNTAWSHNTGNILDGLQQRVVLTGHCWWNPSGSYTDWDYVSVESTVLTVTIDIMPGTTPNYINLKSKGVNPVAILTDNNFDASTVDPLSVEFGPNGAKEIHSKGHIQDVDGDGDLDMVLHFNTKETGIQCGDTKASLIGKTTNGLDITGTDVILTVGCGSKSSESIIQSEVNPQESYELYPNYPNPFITETEIRFSLPEDNHVLIKIYNINGEEIRTLVNEQCINGEHKIRWDGTDGNGNPVSKGFYLYQIKAGSFTKVEKMSLIR
jgi:hypothetical protein